MGINNGYYVTKIKDQSWYSYILRDTEVWSYNAKSRQNNSIKYQSKRFLIENFDIPISTVITTGIYAYYSEFISGMQENIHLYFEKPLLFLYGNA